MKYVYQFGKSSNAIIALALLFLLLVLGAEYGLGISIDMAHMIKPALQVVLGVFILLVILIHWRLKPLRSFGLIFY